MSKDYFNRLDITRQPQRGDILYTLVGSYGIPVRVDGTRQFCVQRHIGILRPSTLIDVDFFRRVLSSDVVRNQADRDATGIAQKTVPLSALRAFDIPVPPFAEQTRIVTKFEQLMALCDRLEAAQAERERRRSAGCRAFLHRHVDDASRASLHQSPSPFLPGVHRLITGRMQIGELRQATLTLAVSGRLGPQDSTDETADALVERISRAASKSHSSVQGLPRSAGSNEDFFALPDSWRWVRLGDIAHGLRYGTSVKCFPRHRR